MLPVRHFETIEELRLALLDFAAWYNTKLAGRPPWPPDQQPPMDRPA